IGVQRANHAQIVRDAGETGKQLTDLQARPAAATERERRAQKRLGAGFTKGRAENGLAVVLAEARLVVEGIDVRKAASEEDEDQVLGPRREVSRFRSERTAL